MKLYAPTTLAFTQNPTVITLPLILQLARHPELKPLLKSQLQAGTLSAADVALLAQDVVAQGDVDRAWAVAERCYQKATRLLAGRAAP